MAHSNLTRRALLGGLAALALPVAARPAPALMLAREAPVDVDPRGHLVSEKLDGVRAHWDGRTLRFRSGLPVAAPAWFTAGLPALPLDGELWLGRGRFEALVSAVRKANPVDAEWRAVRYALFDLPGGEGAFAERAVVLRDTVARCGHPALVAVEQRTLADRAALLQALKAVVDGGGEGLVLHRARARWHAGRSGDLLKLKPLADAEALVVGHAPGRGRFAGQLGALRVRTAEGVEFLIGTGFSDEERARPPSIGRVVTYTHRGLTNAGVPRFASYWRVREL
jgi:DNA ligase 1